MDIFAAAEDIKTLYRNGITAEARWDTARKSFHDALANSTDPAPLEEVILRDENWEISVDLRTALLERAKVLGASSHAFLCEYYGFIGMHMDPGPEHDAMRAKLDELMGDA